MASRVILARCFAQNFCSFQGHCILDQDGTKRCSCNELWAGANCDLPATPPTMLDLLPTPSPESTLDSGSTVLLVILASAFLSLLSLCYGIFMLYGYHALGFRGGALFLYPFRALALCVRQVLTEAWSIPRQLWCRADTEKTVALVEETPILDPVPTEYCTVPEPPTNPRRLPPGFPAPGIPVYRRSPAPLSLPDSLSTGYSQYLDAADELEDDVNEDHRPHYENEDHDAHPVGDHDGSEDAEEDPVSERPLTPRRSSRISARSGRL